ncbi:MAG: Transcriptional regulator, MarR family, partial [uncultured Rubrobacteraceae bacterium]
GGEGLRGRCGGLGSGTRGGVAGAHHVERAGVGEDRARAGGGRTAAARVVRRIAGAIRGAGWAFADARVGARGRLEPQRPDAAGGQAGGGRAAQTRAGPCRQAWLLRRDHGGWEGDVAPDVAGLRRGHRRALRGAPHGRGGPRRRRGARACSRRRQIPL